jgi:hypothetical protein
MDVRGNRTGQQYDPEAENGFPPQPYQCVGVMNSPLVSLFIRKVQQGVCPNLTDSENTYSQRESGRLDTVLGFGRRTVAK